MTILILDVGTSSIRALLFDDMGRLLPDPDAIVSQPHQWETEPPGAAVFDFNLLQTHVEAVIDRVLLHPAAAALRGIGMATLVGNVVALDAAGQAISPIYTYADTRSSDDKDLLRGEINVADSWQRTGCPLHTAYLPARLRWLRRTQPLLFEQTACWADLGSALMGHWYGEIRTSYSVASWSGIFNRQERTWDSEWMSRCHIDTQKLPTLTDYDQPLRHLRPVYAARWPQLERVPFFLAVGDGAANNVGCGCVRPGQIALTVGTTAALRTVSQQALPVVPPGLWSYSITTQDHLIGGATTEGGGLFRWARDVFALPDRATLEAALLASPADAHGLTVIPTFAGERSPGWAADAVGTIHGLRLSTSPVEIVQALIEAVALRLALIAEQLTNGLTEPAKIVASGGALESSPAWAQIITNALNQPVQFTEERELTARGVALLVRHALDSTPLDADPPQIVRVLAPQPAQTERLSRARERQVQLYQQFYP